MNKKTEKVKEMIEKIEGKPIKERTELFIKVVRNLSDVMGIRLKDIYKYCNYCPLCLRPLEEESSKEE